MQFKKLTPVIIVAAVITLVSLWPSSGKGIELFPHADKAGHFCMYALLSFISVRTFPASLLTSCEMVDGERLKQHNKNRIGRKIWIFAACSFYGFVIEIMQELMPYNRTFEWGDAAANTLGAAVGILVQEFLAGNEK